MMKLTVFLICMIIIGCSAAEPIDLSGQQLYGYKPNSKLNKERTSPIVEEQKIGDNSLLRYQDGVSFLITPNNSILSVEASSELEPMDSRDGIRRGDSMTKVAQRLGKSFTTRTEQGAKIYTYDDSKNSLILEFWTTEDKVQTIRFKKK
jgi:hypothetical protein